MTRAALLPAGSDPFVLAYWLRNFATWAKFVDELHIAVCGPLEDEPLAWMEELVGAIPGATMYHVEQRTDHGTVMAYLFDRTQADHIMFCEDDAYIRRPDIVDEGFRFAEDGGIVATPRDGYASLELVDAASSRFGAPYTYWPCFVFVSRESLAATDRRFGGIRWPAGTVVLDHELREEGVADTFIWASWQLREQGLHEKLFDNHRLSGQKVPEDAPWFHVGSLSSGHGLMFMSDITPENYRFEIDGFRRLPFGNALQRVGWWSRAWRSSEGSIPAYHERYGTGLDQLRSDLDISRDEVDAYQRDTQALVTWA